MLQPSPRTRTPRNPLASDLIVYAWLVASLVACRIALAGTQIDFKNAGQRLIFDPAILAAMAAYGVVGVLLIRPTGFFGMRTTVRGARLAAALGVLLGLASIAVDIVRPIEQVLGIPSAHHPLPEGLLFYWYGGVISEIWFHLVPAPLFVFAFSNLLLRGRHQDAVFLVGLLLLAGWEDRRFLLDPSRWEAIEGARTAVTYAANLTEIWLFRRYGFTAAITQRMTSYALWHVAWPALR